MMIDSIRDVAEFMQKYCILKKLGEGGFGSVYLCGERESGVRRAVKCMEDHRCQNRTYIPGLQISLPNEIVLWKPLSHPNIVTLLEIFFDSEASKWYLVMEYCPGYLDLFDYVDHMERLTDEESATIIRQLVKVVYFLTLHDVDHRDLKDDNILYNPTTQQIKLIDFGCASHLSSAPYTSFSGTDVYIPPEYYKTGSYFALHASVWAVGCLSWVMLDGNSPFQSTAAVAEFKALEQLNPCTNGSVYRLDFIKTCMEPCPDKRILLSDLIRHPWLK